MFSAPADDPWANKADDDDEWDTDPDFENTTTIKAGAKDTSIVSAADAQRRLREQLEEENAKKFGVPKQVEVQKSTAHVGGNLSQPAPARSWQQQPQSQPPVVVGSTSQQVNVAPVSAAKSQFSQAAAPAPARAAPAAAPAPVRSFGAPAAAAAPAPVRSFGAPAATKPPIQAAAPAAFKPAPAPAPAQAPPPVASKPPPPPASSKPPPPPAAAKPAPSLAPPAAAPPPPAPAQIYEEPAAAAAAYDDGSSYDQGGYDDGSSYDQGGYQEGGYDQGTYDDGSGYNQGGYDDGSSYDQGGYQEGGYDQTGYDQGAYDDQSYAQPAQGVKQCRALYDFAGENETDLAFYQDAIITVNDDTDPSGWWHGELNGVSGYFPSNFVELI